MKHIFKLILAAIIFTVAFTTTELRAKEIGLTVGIDYISNYISNHINESGYIFHGNDGNGGGFFPYAFYNIANTGFRIGVMGEIPESWIGGSHEESDQNVQNKMARSFDLNASYSKSIKDITTLSFIVWYYAYKTDNGMGSPSAWNHSYFDFIFSASADMLPLTPTLLVKYNYFIDNDYVRGVYGGKNENILVQLNLNHSFELYEDVYLDLGSLAAWQHRTVNEPILDDISIINLFSGITIKSGILTFTSSFHYVIVPGTQYKNVYKKINSFSSVRGIDIHRFYTQFGVSCNI